MVYLYIYLQDLHLVDFFILNISKHTVPHGFRGFFCSEGTPSLVNGSRQATEGAKMGAGSSMVMAFVLHKVGMTG